MPIPFRLDYVIWRLSTGLETSSHDADLDEHRTPTRLGNRVLALTGRGTAEDLQTTGGEEPVEAVRS